MMLVCPSCDARYMVSDGAIGPAGRKVHCAACGHEWFETGQPDESDEDGLDPEVMEAFEGLTDLEEDEDEEIDLSMLGDMDIGMEEEKSAPESTEPEPEEDDISISGESDANIAPLEEEMDIALHPVPAEEEPLEDGGEPIPEAVKPVSEGSPMGAIDAQGVAQEAFRKRMAGYGAAAGVFVCVIGLMLALKGPLFSVFPGAALLYNILGMEVDLPAQGLVIEKLSADFTETESGARVLNVKGRVINLKSVKQDVPLMLATLRTEDGKDLESWIIDPPYQVLAAEQSFDFEASYPALPEGAYSVNLQFAPYMDKNHSMPKEEEHQTEEHHETPAHEEAPAETHHGDDHH